MTIQKKRKLASLLLILISVVCLAQNVPEPPPPGVPPGLLPIDGGVLIGAFLALCYGTKKLLKK